MAVKMNPTTKAKVGLFVAGFAAGTLGIKALTSKDAKKAYTHCTAAVFRAKDSVVKTATTLQENCQDIAAEARQINEELRAAQAELDDVVADSEAEEVEEAAEEGAES